MKRIDSKKNERFKNWKKLKDKKYRERFGELLVEGSVVIEEIYREGYVKEILIDEKRLHLSEDYQTMDVPVTVLNHALFEELVSTETSQGAIAVCRHFLINLKEFPTAGKFLYTDGIQDPGNLGGMIRSAEAFRFDGILLGQGTVDPGNDKCVRSSMASAFRIPVAKISDNDLKALHGKMSFYALDIRGQTIKNDLSTEENLVLIVGNEARGLREAILALVDHRLRIPMKETIDSLNANVATSIAMFMIGGRK